MSEGNSLIAASVPPTTINCVNQGATCLHIIDRLRRTCIRGQIIAIARYCSVERVSNLGLDRSIFRHGSRVYFAGQGVAKEPPDVLPDTVQNISMNPAG